MKFHEQLKLKSSLLLIGHAVFIQVAKTRAAHVDRFSTTNAEDQAINVELATSLAEIYREREEYELLALHYLGIGNDELLDKYIELAIQQGMADDSLIFFRSVQHRLDLIPEEVKRRQIKKLEDQGLWFSLGRLYRIFEIAGYKRQVIVDGGCG